MPDVSGIVLPISYQYELAQAFHQLLTADLAAYESWLSTNGLQSLTHEEAPRAYSLSNLYVPKILVEGDRLSIQVPRIQFWVSMLPQYDTREFLESALLGKVMAVGDAQSSVSFRISAIDNISPVIYRDRMEYQTLSPIVVKALRNNGTLEYLSPTNPYFSEFMYEGLVERWENFYGRRFEGIRGFQFQLLAPERRKAVNVGAGTPGATKVVSYMLKFRLEMDAELQEFAYITGIGDDLENGFGYIELLKKKK